MNAILGLALAFAVVTAGKAMVQAVCVACHGVSVSDGIPNKTSFIFTLEQLTAAAKAK